jgi:hypothetical protein
VASVDITYKIEALPRAGYRAWRLTASAINAVDTTGATDDPNIFVLKVKRRADEVEDTFSHVASLWEMNNTPSDRSDIPPKSAGFYRSSVLILDFNNKEALDLGIELLEHDVRLLLYAADGQDTVSEYTESY